ncbi:phosphotransferase [Clostridium sp.]|uniref:phosphotransferase n=1 Tax=Clostridium sp. TaxID=1506 RepID=UPI00262AA4A7|nr:phosphotransferase [Clostridium sp.]
MLTHEIEILKILNNEENISQRKLADMVGISVGKVNALLKELLEREYIIKNYIDKKTFKYELTEAGVALLESSLNQIKNTKLSIHKGKFYKVKEAVILGAGGKGNFGKPAGFLEIEEFRIIDRIIEALKSNGIEKIVIVNGYKKEFYEELAEKDSSIVCVTNSAYKWTGTMSSLALAKEHITHDFILVENDLVFESRAVEQIIKNENRDCILLTNESGSGDEAFVEIRDGYLFKMSKDIHQFNRIDGEMVGISKISYKLFNMMLEEFKFNINPYMNYEYTMLDVARNYKVGYEKINDLVWGEIDNEEQYDKIRKHIIPMIRRREMQYKIEQVRNAIIEGLGVSENNIKEILPVGGMTNKNYKAFVDNKAYIVRIPGAGTSSMINRKDEMRNSKLAAKKGIDAKILFFDEESGVKIAELIEGAETLNQATAKKKENMELVVGALRTLHNSELPMENRFDVFEKIEDYENIVKKVNGTLFEDYDETKARVLKLEKTLEEYGMEIKPCHNDTVPENFVKDINERMFLIDWEYSGLNDPMWDLAAHSIECDFSEDDEELFLDIYFNNSIEEKHKIRILIYKICQDFLWSIWTVLKEAQGDDFGTYGIDRYNRGKKNLDLLDKILMEK